MDKIRVLVVDDQQLVREGIASLLALQPTIDVVGTASNGREGMEAERELAPAVILMDIRMPSMDGITAVERLRARGSRARILMLTTFDDVEYVVKSLRAGAEGYLMKDLPAEDLTRAIEQVYTGTYQLAPGVMGSLLSRLDEPHPREETAAPSDPEMQRLWERFSIREREILRLLGRGATNREIARRIHLSEGTVKNYVSDILTSLDLRDRTQAALLAVRNGWDRED